MSVVEPPPNPDTVDAVLDVLWHLTSVELSRTDALDRRATAVASFASLLAGIVAGLGARVADAAQSASIGILAVTLGSLFLAVAVAIRALLPQELSTINARMVRRIVTREVMTLAQERLGSAVARAVAEALLRERATNRRKSTSIGLALRLLLGGTAGAVVLGATLALQEVTG